jgi:lysozyme
MRANRGEWEGAAEAFRNHVTAAGKVLPGLVKRREAEIALFLS